MPFKKSGAINCMAIMGPIVMEKTSQNKAEYKKFFEALSSALNIQSPA
jgi:hypothetical protein